MANMGSLDAGLRSGVSALTRALEDSAYVAVGFGVLGWQRAQVRRRQVQSGFGGRLAGLGRATQKLATTAQKFGTAAQWVGTAAQKVEREGARPLQSTVGTTARAARDAAAHIPNGTREVLAEACAVGARSLRALRVVLEQARPAVD